MKHPNKSIFTLACSIVASSLLAIGCGGGGDDVAGGGSGGGQGTGPIEPNEADSELAVTEDQVGEDTPPLEMPDTAGMTSDEIQREKEFVESAQAENEGNQMLLNELSQAIEEFYADYNKLPSGWAQLVSEGYLDGLPRIPAGKRVKIDGKTLKVTFE